jgi:glycosyltransferase involved in cell wall biosynthesis
VGELERVATRSPAAAPAPGPRLLVLGRVVAGYTWRLLREVERCGVEIRAVYRDAPAAMAPQFAHESGPEGGVAALNFDRASLPEAARFMEAGRADAILVLGGSANVPLLLLACARKRPETPVWLFTDANVPSGRAGSPRDWARHVLYRGLRPLVDEAWTLGRSNEAALVGFGLRSQRRLPLYAIDFAALAQGRPRAAARRDLRIRLLCVARLSPEKNLLALCEALQAEGVAGRFELTLVGEGPQRPALEDAARRSRCPIRLLGAVPRREMGAVFADADALVLPSAWEPWGIAVVEALGLGLPVVATSRVGSAVSLAATQGGVVLSTGTEPGSLRAALARLASELEPLRAAAREGAGAVRSEFGTEGVAHRVADAVRHAQHRRGVR